MVSTLAFHPGDPGSIPCMDNQIFNISFSPSHPSGVTKPSSLKLATSGITSPSIGKNNITQAESSKFASLSFDQGFQDLRQVYQNRSECHLTVFCIDLYKGASIKADLLLQGLKLMLQKEGENFIILNN